MEDSEGSSWDREIGGDSKGSWDIQPVEIQWDERSYFEFQDSSGQAERDLVGLSPVDVESPSPPAKRRKLDVDADNGGEEVTGAASTINDRLPNELLWLILNEASEESKKVMWVVGRCVCRLWRRLYPSAKRFLRLKVAGTLSLGGEAALRGWLPILKWMADNGLTEIGPVAQSAALRGHTLVLEWIEDDISDLSSFKFMEMAAKERQLEVLIWAWRRGYILPPEALVEAASNGDIRTLKWCVQKGGNPKVSSAVLFAAARGGHLKILQWVDTSDIAGGKLQKLITEAAAGGNVEVLRWVCNNWRMSHNCGPTACKAAAANCHLKVLKWLWGRGCTPDRTSTVAAAERGNFEMLQWLRLVGCPWSSKVTCEAARLGLFDVLRWCVANCGTELKKEMNSAAKGGHVEILKWLRAKGCPWDRMTTQCAISAGQLEALKWLRANDCPWDAKVFQFAAESGRADILQWISDNKTANIRPVDSKIMKCAIVKDHLDAVKWLHRAGVELNTECCVHAARAGSLAVLQWLWKKRVPWNEKVLKAGLDKPIMNKWILGLVTRSRATAPAPFG